MVIFIELGVETAVGTRGLSQVILKVGSWTKLSTAIARNHSDPLVKWGHFLTAPNSKASLKQNAKDGLIYIHMYVGNCLF